jgi:hypothetical protein
MFAVGRWFSTHLERSFVMKFRSALSALIVFGLVFTAFVNAKEEKAVADDAKKEDVLKNVKCPMSGRDIDKEKFVAYKDAKVFLCCGNCVKGFADASKKEEVAMKANHQLVMTKQVKQVKCALNGKGKVNKEAKTKVAGVNVNFCCENCLGKVTKMDEKEQLKTLFTANFDKAFEVVKKGDKKDEDEDDDDKDAA